MSDAPRERQGRIVTFYSYKGGTGRSMAVANVGWILAMAGYRVLLVDWDLEAPGLHRYLHPFLDDAELVRTPGVIDFFVDFATAARQVEGTESAGEPGWFESVAGLLRYAQAVDWRFPGKGALELVGAGRQDAAYAMHVTSFDWQGFYTELGGGVFLEAVKRRLRQDYDYVLIDSRTGVSDTAGVCTVQMPDDLIVCFTLNRQSTAGAAAVATAADQQRRKPDGSPSLRIWPVPTRIELAEKERLEAARERARPEFARFIGHLPRSERERYWDEVEILYLPFYAYEEVLAPFVEKRPGKTSLLRPMLAITRYLSRGAVETMPLMPESERAAGLARLLLPTATKKSTRPLAGDVYLSYPREAAEHAASLRTRLEGEDFHVRSDADLLPGDNWQQVLGEALSESSIVLALVGSSGALGHHQRQEVESAIREGKRLIPVLAPGASFDRLPAEMQALQAVHFDDEGFSRLVTGLQRILQEGRAPLDPEDPQKGRWGGRAERDGRVLSAEVGTVSEDWFSIELAVTRTGGAPLEGEVQFFLHPSFYQSHVSVPVRDSSARLQLGAWGAFTVGAVCDGGRTTLELDLAEDSRFPQRFRER